MFPPDPYKYVEQKREYFKKAILGFSIDANRRSYVAVYVNVEFLIGHVNRDKLIKEYIEKNAPWIFNYGKRATQDGK